MSKLELDGSSLRLKDLLHLEDCKPSLSASAVQSMNAAVTSLRKIVDEGQVVYGVNTGFGAFANRRIDRDAVETLQYNLVRSHACGVGQPLPSAVVRRAMLLKANSLAAALSGARPLLAETLLAMVDHDITPLIPSRGSVAASGDLAPLAHMALALIGEGEARQGDRELSGSDVLEAAGVKPVVLQAKEGLAMINGTQISTALAVEGLIRAERLLNAAIVIGALSVEALAGSFTPFDQRIHKASNLQGQQKVAEQFRNLLTGSDINNSHVDCDRVQDPYSLRCMPQVLGAVWDALDHVADVLARQINGVTDNPLIFGNDVLSGGNFHAEPLGFVCDYMTIAVAELASIAERRID
ncbi:MAG: aromatic amino acid lyase, partial [Gammaproteobacteria bacterium]|nr:aromatic amino acid lyase [Gammaproteobacteria bacterium]